MSNWRVTITAPDGEPMIVHPEKEATHGVYLAEDQVKGDIIDAPVKTEWDQTTLQEGGTQRGVDYEYRDFMLGFHVTDNKIDAAEADSMLRMKLDYEEDEWDPNPQRQTRIDIEAVGGAFAGSKRSIDVLMHETPEIEFARDPMMDQYTNPQFALRAGQPMYYEPMKMSAFTWTDADVVSGEVNGFVYVENRTDRAMRHSWVVAAGVGAMAHLPDFSWVGARGKRQIAGPHPTRVIPVSPVTAQGGGIRVTLERGKVMVTDKNGTNAMGRMPVPGMTFLYRIPPYTRRTALPVKVTNVPPGGGRIELRMPQLWSRPIGLEMW